MGCQRMDAVTYPDAEVNRFINAEMIPVRVRSNSEPLATNFNVRWTPTLVTLDPEGHEHHRTVGYLTPEDLIPSLMLGIAKWRFDEKQFDLAEKGLESVLQKYPKSDAAPEALYLQGVSCYKQSNNLADMKKAYQELVARYPESDWARRAQPYSQAP